jgi:hypothetical protein
MFPSDHCSNRRSGLLEQRLLGDHVGFAAFSTLGPGIVGVDVAATIWPEIALGLDEWPRIGDDIENALIEGLGGDWLGQKLSDASVSCGHDALFFRMPGEHDDGHIGIVVSAGLADHLGEFQAVKDRHSPVGNDDIGRVMGKSLQAPGTVFGLVDLARAEPMQQRSQDPPHVGVVIDNEEAQPIKVDADHVA